MYVWRLNTAHDIYSALGHDGISRYSGPKNDPIHQINIRALNLEPICVNP